MAHITIHRTVDRVLRRYTRRALVRLVCGHTVTRPIDHTPEQSARCEQCEKATRRER